MSKKRVSFICANYNYGHFISLTIETIFNQSYQNVELIIVDDCSTDNSVQIIKEYQKKYSNITLIQNETNIGGDASFNKGAQIAEGEYLVFRASDDANHAGYTEKSVKMLDTHPQAGLCCADIQEMHEEIGDGRILQSAWVKEAQYLSPETLIDVVGQRQVFGHTVMVRKEYFLEVGGFPVEPIELRWLSDTFVFFIIAFRHGLCYIPEPLVAARVSPEGFSASGFRDKKKYKEMLKNMLLCLTQNYADVVPAFMRSCWFGYYGPIFAETVLEFPELHSMEYFFLTQHNFHQFNSRPPLEPCEFRGQFASILEKHSQRLRFEYGKLGSRIAFYGSGNHTRILLEEWRKLFLPPVDCIINTKKLPESTIFGLPLKGLEEVKREQYDLIVISSRAFENDIHTIIKENFEGAPVMRFWDREQSDV